MDQTSTAEPTPRQTATQRCAPPEQHVASKRVLLVEDEPLTAEVFERCLSRAGYAVEHAADGLQAVNRHQDWRPDLIVLDMSLPTMSGADVVRHLRSRGDDVPILVISGCEQWQSTLTDEELRPGLWLTKPIKPRKLIAIVEDVLAGRGPDALS
jgi:DNA-binding response OmpR family regulator